MKKKYFSLLILLLLVFAITTTYLVLSRTNSKLTIKSENIEMNYYIPDVLVELEEGEESQKYYLLTGPYEESYSFKHLRFDHWWAGIFGLYLVINDSSIVESKICIEQSLLDKICYLPSQVMGDITKNEINKLDVQFETSLGTMELFLKKIPLSNVKKSAEISDQYESF